MDRLQGYQKRFLRGLAHSLKPEVFVGQKGFTAALAAALDDALGHHELVKVKFVEFKDKERKRSLIRQIEKAAACESVGMVGHTAIFFRRQDDPEKRKIAIPRHRDE
jgi:RNA-binding protein